MWEQAIWIAAANMQLPALPNQSFEAFIDGAAKVEQQQILADRSNNDTCEALILAPTREMASPQSSRGHISESRIYGHAASRFQGIHGFTRICNLLGYAIFYIRKTRKTVI